MSNFQVQKIFFNVYEIPEGKDKPSVREVTMQRKVKMSSSDGPILSSENWSLQETNVQPRNAIKPNIGGKLLCDYCYTVVIIAIKLLNFIIIVSIMIILLLHPVAPLFLSLLTPYRVII